MTDRDWGQLRRELAKQFDEDIVQQVLLELLEVQAKGVAVLDPLRWCRRAASRDRYDRRRREARESHTIPAGLRTPGDPLTRLVAHESLRGHEAQALDTDLSLDPKRAEHQRSGRRRRRRRALGGAA